MIRVEHVSKRFAGRAAVRDLSLDVPAGSLYGLLGPNGAGKSTIIGCMLGQVYPDAGRVHVDGHDVAADRRRALARVGAIFEAPAFYDYLSGRRNLRLFSSLTGPATPQRVAEVVRLTGLTARIDDRVGSYSHGMRQRLALAQALLPDPRVLILDEPSDGLDPEGIREMRDLVLTLNREWGLTILLSSHLLGEVEQVCTHVAILREGRLCYAGPWRERAASNRWLRLETDRDGEATRRLIDAGLVDEAADGQVKVAADHTPAQVAAWLVERGVQLHALAPLPASLESFYLSVARQADVDPRPER